MKELPWPYWKVVLAHITLWAALAGAFALPLLALRIRDHRAGLVAIVVCWLVVALYWPAFVNGFGVAFVTGLLVTSLALRARRGSSPRGSAPGRERSEKPRCAPGLPSDSPATHNCAT